MTDQQNYNKNKEISSSSIPQEQTDSLDCKEQTDEQTPQQKSNTITSSIENFIRGHIPTNIFLAIIFTTVIYYFYNDYDTNNRFSSLLAMINLCCITLFIIIRKAPIKTSEKPIDWATAILSTLILLFISPVPAQNEIIFLMLAQIFGTFIAIIATINLNTSFSLIPAMREIKTSGLYNLVRHPLYLGFFITFTCLALQNFTVLNVVIVAAIYAMNIHRIKAEEEILSENTNYQLYKMRVRWRLLPFIW